jgi:PPOX class probable F420-dependent enzyme
LLLTAPDGILFDAERFSSEDAVTDLVDFTRVASADHNFCVIATTRRDGTVQASVVSAGVMSHPASRTEVVVCVARGNSRKLANLRARPAATVVASTGGAWVAVEGRAELIGPDDPNPRFDDEALRQLLRDAFRAAGGDHDDWPTYDRVMIDERRAVVLITPARVYSNG